MKDIILKFCEKILFNVSFKDVCLLSLICLLSVNGVDRTNPSISYVIYIIYVLSCTIIFLFLFSYSVAIYVDMTKHIRRDK